MGGERGDRRVGGAAAVDRDMRLLAAANVRIGPAGPVELARMVERRRLGPGPPQQRDILRGAAIAKIVVAPVAVLGLIGIAAAGDDVYRQTAVAQLVQGRELPGGDRRRHEPRSVREEETEALGDRGGVRPDEEPVGRIREIADEDAVEPGALVNAGGLGNDLGVERRAGW